MATMRQIDTRFWVDTWVRKLNALDRYAFIYFLTNSHSNWCGVYELDISMAAFESGIDEHDLKKTIIPRLSPKIIYIDGWVYIKNFVKYHENGSEQTKKGIENAWQSVPEKIRLKIAKISQGDIPPIYPLVGGCSSSSSSSLSLEELSKDSVPSKTLKEYRNLRRRQIGKEDMAGRPATKKQLANLKRMRCLDYFHEVGVEQGFEYLKEEDDQANRKFIGLARAFEKRFPNNWKDVIDWWFSEDNAWCDYQPANFFTITTWMKFENKGNKKIKGEWWKK